MRRLQVHDDLKRGLYLPKHAWSAQGRVRRPAPISRTVERQRRSRAHRESRTPRIATEIRSALSLQGALDNCGQVRS